MSKAGRKAWLKEGMQNLNSVQKASVGKVFRKLTSDVTSLCETRPSYEEVAMRNAIWAAMTLFLGTTAAYADMGFDERYERDYNIFNPVNRYQPDNPLNPVNQYDPDNIFNPVNRYDPGNPANPINLYNPNNPFNPVNQYRSDNPLNPVNKYNFDVPFAPLDGRSGRRTGAW